MFGSLCERMNDDRLPRQFCTFEGQRLAYVQLGAGSAVLLLHGLGGTADFGTQLWVTWPGRIR